MNTVVGASRGFNVTFTSDDGASISNLSITSGLTLPAGWTGPATFTCATVSTGNGCLLSLNYAPTAAGSGTITLAYSYTNNAGTAKTGSLDVAYASTVGGNNVVTQVSPAGQILGIVGGSQPVSFTFVTDDHLVATNLDITAGLTNLPTGWSGPSTTFHCDSVSNGNGCQLTLNFTPAATGSGSITLSYSYTDSASVAKTGTKTVTYAATTQNHVIGTVNPPGEVTGVINGTQPVSVTFASDDGNAVTGFSVTTNLASGLPAGWSSTSSTFTCATITRDSACELDLSYAPTVTDQGQVTLGYTYTDHTGSVQTGTVVIPYLTTLSDNVVGAVSPSPVRLLIGDSKTVFVTFTTDDGNTATGLTLTTPNFGTTLPSGWSTDPGTFSCSAVSTTAVNSCRLRLFYQPTQAANSSFSIGYSYTNNLAVVKHGTINVQYRARFGQAFVANGGSTLAACDVLGNGTLDDCKTTGQGFGGAEGLAFDDDFAYVAGGAGAVRLCLANNDGSLSNCSTLLSSQSNLKYLDATTTRLYIAQGNASVQSCPIETNGTLDTCVATGTTPSAGVIALSVGSFHAYLAHTDGNIYHCNVSQSTGLLGSCTSTGQTFSSPRDVRFVKSHLYVANSDSTVTVCTVDLAGNGGLSACSPSAMHAPPVSISVLLTHAYVTDGATNVYVCDVDGTTGALSNCTATTGGGTFATTNQISVN